MRHHIVDWQQKGTVAVVNWCEWKFLQPAVVLQQEERATCPKCEGELYHSGEFRTVVCKEKAKETVREMFRQLLKEDEDVWTIHKRKEDQPVDRGTS